MISEINEEIASVSSAFYKVVFRTPHLSPTGNGINYHDLGGEEGGGNRGGVAVLSAVETALLCEHQMPGSPRKKEGMVNFRQT